MRRPGVGFPRAGGEGGFRGATVLRLCRQGALVAALLAGFLHVEQALSKTPTDNVAQALSEIPADKPAHHTPNGFRNIYPAENHGLGDLLKWRWDWLIGRIPARPPNEPPTPAVPPDLAFLRGNASVPSVTWIGHATFLVQVGGRNILTDPHFSRRASPFAWVGPSRLHPPAIALADLPPIHAVVISHNHYDHLDLASVAALAARGGPGEAPRFFVPLGVKAFLTGEGIGNVVELDWWQEQEYLGVRFTAVPAQHFSARSLFDRNETLWAGWVVSHPDFRFYHAGDTGSAPHFREIGRRLGPIDLAALPIGAYEPRWFMRAVHINPAEAVQAHQELGTRYSVAMHWGTFDLTDESPAEPPRALARALEAAAVAPQRFFLMSLGETRQGDQLPQLSNGEGP